MNANSPASSEPLVSVVIAAFNAADTLEQTIESVLAQSRVGFRIEIVIVDDGSTDSTWELLKGHAGHVRAVRQPNSGIGAARNRGMREARGDFIALLDADDLCDPARLQIQLAYLLEHPTMLLCSTDFSSFDSSGVLEVSSIGSYYSRCHARYGGVRARYQEHDRLIMPIAACGLPAGSVVECHSGRVFEQMAQGSFIHPGTSMFRRSALDLAGNFDLNIRIACEWEWLARVTREGSVGYIDLPLLAYRRSAGQVSSSPDMNLDSLHVAKMLHQRYPQLRLNDPAAVRRQFGNLELQAAYALAPVHRRKAFALLLSSLLRRRVCDAVSLRTLLRIVLPTPAMRGLRALRGRLCPTP